MFATIGASDEIFSNFRRLETQTWSAVRAVFDGGPAQSPSVRRCAETDDAKS